MKVALAFLFYSNGMKGNYQYTRLIVMMRGI